MASGSSKVERPAWQKTLLAVPVNERSTSQSCFIMSFKQIDTAANILCDPTVCQSLDAMDTRVLKALWLFARVSVDNGSFPSPDYYMPPKTHAKVYRAFYTIFRDSCKQQSVHTSPDPEILVPLALSAATFSGMHLYLSYHQTIPQTDIEKSYGYMAKDSRRRACLSLLRTLGDSSIKARCDEYMHTKLGPLDIDNPMQAVCGVLAEECARLESATCVPVATFPSLDMDRYCEFLEMVGLQSDHDYDLVGLGALPKGVVHSGCLEGLGFYFRRLSECHIHRLRSSPSPVARSDPLELKWRETSSSYFKLLKHAIEQAQLDSPVDIYSIAMFHRQSLIAMLYGVSEYVSYTEIKSVCNAMKSAADACAAWTPPLWKLQIETDCNIVFEEVLPFLRNVNPSSYETASVSVLTPGFLDFYTPTAVYQHLYGKRLKKCDACGINAINLLKCKACESAWYCDRECQVKGWKQHKVECKKSQRAHGAV